MREMRKQRAPKIDLGDGLEELCLLGPRRSRMKPISGKALRARTEHCCLEAKTPAKETRPRYASVRRRATTRGQGNLHLGSSTPASFRLPLQFKTPWIWCKTGAPWVQLSANASEAARSWPLSSAIDFKDQAHVQQKIPGPEAEPEAGQKTGSPLHRPVPEWSPVLTPLLDSPEPAQESAR